MSAAHLLSSRCRSSIAAALNICDADEVSGSPLRRPASLPATFAAAAFEPVGDDEMLVGDWVDAAAAAASAPASAAGKAEMGTALYVAMPRPFVFNVPGAGRDRLVQIKVQLLVRGSDNEELAKTHIPLIEGTLLQAFSTSNADDLVTEAGKIELREQAVTEVQKALKDITGSDVVERVLFTGFVMQ